MPESTVDAIPLFCYDQVGDGAKNVSVGTLIAMLAEEGDDISNLQPPSESESKPAPKKEESASSSSSSSSTSTPSPPQPQPSASTHHDFPKGPIFPSVMRLLAAHNVPVKDVKKIKGTGVRGMLTKGDVLAHLGLASTPTGTFKITVPKDTPAAAGKGAKSEGAKKVCFYHSL
jgi:pyruvate/2-oxoglutarate dehydrogenase complex dihydrolipoamide acyltransferase (E2) component